MQDSKGAGRHSQGFQTLRFDIQEIVNGFAYGVDNFSVPRKIAMTLQTAKGAMPQPGESWLISKTMTGAYMFFACINSPGGVAQTLQFSFTYKTPSLATGAALYVPQVGETLLNAWVQVTEAFNGTTPKLDMGYGPAGNVGIMGAVGVVQDMTVIDGTVNMLTTGSFPDLAIISAIQFASSTSGTRLVPSQFNGDFGTPFVVWVTQDGTNNGAVTGATEGAAILHLETIPPA